MRNTIKSVNDVEIYETKIHEWAGDYIDSLNSPDDIYNNPSLFTGMLKHIYKHLFKPGKNDKVLSNTNSKLDLSNIELLDNIWGIYTELCYKYGKRPTILNFSLMIGVDNSTIDTWRKGEYRSGGDGANSARSATVKKWLKECESSLVDGATEKNSIGCIFALKANYGYSEGAQRVEITQGQTAEQVAADIAARHSITQNTVPTLPDFDVEED